MGWGDKNTYVVLGGKPKDCRMQSTTSERCFVTQRMNVSSIAESVPVETSAATGTFPGTPDGCHVEYSGEIQVAPVLCSDQPDSRTRRLHSSSSGPGLRYARQIQVS
jgi:hypothetical protein